MNDTESAYNAGLAAATHHVVGADAIPYAIIPAGAALRPLEELLPVPVRKRGTALCNDLESFLSYVDEHKIEHQTRIFAEKLDNGIRFEAIFDHHGSTAEQEAGWCKHRCQYVAEYDHNFAAWCSLIGESWVGQRKFAEFIEEHVAQIYNPPGAQVLEMASDLAAKTDVEFRSAVNLDNGTAQLHYEETLQTGGGKGAVPIPKMLTLQWPVYRGGDAYQSVLRLRVKVGSGKVEFKLVAAQLEDLLIHVNRELVAKVEKLSKIKVLLGRWCPIA